jgi:hypothetical protein
MDAIGGYHVREVGQDQKHKRPCFLSNMEDRSKDKHIHKNKHGHIPTQI